MVKFILAAAVDVFGKRDEFRNLKD